VSETDTDRSSAMVWRRLSPAQATTRGRLVQGAADLAAEGGYDAVTVRAVAARTGLSPATAYQFFSSKDEMLVAALEDLIQRSEASAARREAEGESATDRLRALFAGVMREVEQRPQLYRALFMAWISRHASGDTDVLGQRSSWIALGRNDPADSEDAVTEAILVYVLLGSMVALVTGQSPAGINDTVDEALRRLLPRDAR
jgi:AcrR family transcriptional regulator